MTTTNLRVTIRGLGATGTALANAQLDRGQHVTLWRRTPDRANALTQWGAIAAAVAEEVWAISDFVGAGPGLAPYWTSRGVFSLASKSLKARSRPPCRLVRTDNAEPRCSAAPTFCAGSADAESI